MPLQCSPFVQVGRVKTVEFIGFVVRDKNPVTGNVRSFFNLQSSLRALFFLRVLFRPQKTQNVNPPPTIAPILNVNVITFLLSQFLFSPVLPSSLKIDSSHVSFLLVQPPSLQLLSPQALLSLHHSPLILPFLRGFERDAVQLCRFCPC